MEIHQQQHPELLRQGYRLIAILQSLGEPRVVRLQVLGPVFRFLHRHPVELPADVVRAEVLDQGAEVLLHEVRTVHRPAQALDVVALEPLGLPLTLVPDPAALGDHDLIEPGLSRHEFQPQHEGRGRQLLRRPDHAEGLAPRERPAQQVELGVLPAFADLEHQHHLDAVPVVRLGAQALGPHPPPQGDSLAPKFLSREAQGRDGALRRLIPRGLDDVEHVPAVDLDDLAGVPAPSVERLGALEVLMEERLRARRRADRRQGQCRNQEASHRRLPSYRIRHTSPGCVANSVKPVAGSAAMHSPFGPYALSPSAPRTLATPPACETIRTEANSPSRHVMSTS